MPDIASPTSQPDATRLVEPILAGNDVTLFIRSDDGRALLDAAAEALATLRCRVFRATGTPSEGLSLPVLMTQMFGQPVPGRQNDEFLKRGFQALTTPDATCDRIVLLISDANTLQPAALRYIQLACRAGASLQLVLAGKRGFLDLLGPNEFAHLRARLATGPIITPSGPAAAPAASAAPRRPLPSHGIPAPRTLERPARPSRPLLSSSSSRSSQKRLAALAGIGLALAACTALAFWSGSGELAATPSQQAVLALELPTVIAPAPAIAAVPDAPLPVAAPVPDAPLPAAPLPAAVPVAPQPPVAAQEVSVPVVPPLAAPSVIPPPGLNKGNGRKATQPRFATARAPAFNSGSVAAWEDPYSPPQRDWQPLPPQAMSDLPEQPKSYIGTFTVDANGVRVFHLGR